MLIPAIHKTLTELSHLLAQLSQQEYTTPCADLSNATIGAHTRHIIELFQCLEVSYETGVVNYDDRKRDFRIQTDTAFAVATIEALLDTIDRPNKSLLLRQHLDGTTLSMETNYQRELLYNLEHCIHHQALLKVAVVQLDTVEVHENFGVARSTIAYRKQCAQ
jgi:hypothetical protein